MCSVSWLMRIVSYMLTHVSCILCHVPCVMYPVSCILCPDSCVMYPVSGQLTIEPDFALPLGRGRIVYCTLVTTLDCTLGTLDCTLYTTLAVQLYLMQHTKQWNLQFKLN